MADWNLFWNKRQEYVRAKPLWGLSPRSACVPAPVSGWWDVPPENSAHARADSQGLCRGDEESPRSATQAGLVRSNYFNVFECKSNIREGRRKDRIINTAIIRYRNSPGNDLAENWKGQRQMDLGCASLSGFHRATGEGPG